MPNCFAKKWLAGIMAAVFALVSLPSPACAATAAETLTQAIEKSFLADNLQLKSDGKISMGANEIIPTFEMKQDDGRYQTTNTFQVNFDASALPEDLLKEMGILKPDLKVTVESASKTYFNTFTKDIFYIIDNYDFRVTTSDADLKTVIEGFAEIPKFFTQKMYYLNTKKLQESFPEEFKDFTEMDLGNTFSKEDAVRILNALILSGLLEVTSSGNVYTVTLPSEVAFFDPQPIIDAIEASDFIPEDVKTDMIAELNNFDNDQDLADLNNVLTEISKLMTFTAEAILSGDKITTIDLAWNFNLDQILFNEDRTDVDPLKITQNVDLSYTSASVNLPSLTKEVLSFNKIISGFMKMGEIQKRKWEAERQQRFENLAKNPPINSNFNFQSNAWYAPYYKDLASKGILNGYEDPTAEISGSDLNSMLMSAFDYAGAEYAYNYDLAQKTKLNKFEALTYIVKAFYPEEKYPAAFAKRKGIVSKEFNLVKARGKTAVNAEVWKMLSVALQGYGE